MVWEKIVMVFGKNSNANIKKEVRMPLIVESSPLLHVSCNPVARASTYLCCRYEKERTFAILWHRALLCGHSCVDDGCGHDSVGPGLFGQWADKLGKTAYAYCGYCDDCAGRRNLRECPVYEQDR